MSAPIELAISASSRALTCAARRFDGEVYLSPTDGSQQRGAEIATVVAKLLDGLSAKPAEIGRIRLDLGPGSYTGLRVAVTFARMLSRFGGGRAEITTVTSLELLALAATDHFAAASGGSLRVVLDARRERFHTARIERPAAGGLQLAEAPRALSRAALLETIAADETLLIDPELAASLLPDSTPRLEPIEFSAELLFDPRLSPVAADLATLEPLYLMGSYAEA